MVKKTINNVAVETYMVPACNVYTIFPEKVIAESIPDDDEYIDF